MSPISFMSRLAVPALWFAIQCPPSEAAPPPCPGDANADATVNVDDLLAVINAWGEQSETHAVAVFNFEFQPSRLQAKVHDEVSWVLEFGLHTVTSGAKCSGDGRFHVTLSPTVPEFSYVLQPEDVGAIDFFCDPHCAQGMVGTIIVVPFAADTTGDGAVNVDDLLQVINHWGPCV